MIYERGEEEEDKIGRRVYGRVDVGKRDQGRPGAVEWMKVSSEIVQDHRAWSASVRDVVN